MHFQRRTRRQRLSATVFKVDVKIVVSANAQLRVTRDPSHMTVSRVSATFQARSEQDGTMALTVLLSTCPLSFSLDCDHDCDHDHDHRRRRRDIISIPAVFLSTAKYSGKV